ncbi:GNAT family N-acetyltransferase [Psychrobacillus sp. FSL W7-1457]|uniref:GNAT family N-acetyltransferase n=1 Tax=unclassified Psychrobacillus TaxID=2636677 RepID=UPI0030FD0FD3
MNISIERLKMEDIEELYLFESKNRTYFEQTVPSRGEGYYHHEIFMRKNIALLEEQAREESYFFLIKEGKSIIGRINLIDIDKQQKKANLGYRIGAEHSGKGIASLAVALLLQTISWEEINQVNAKTTANNIASQKVLEKNGFQKVQAKENGFYIDGENLEFVHYTLIGGHF